MGAWRVGVIIDATFSVLAMVQAVKTVYDEALRRVGAA
jgi:hypothetical protein